MKNILLFIVLLVFANVVHAQRTNIPPIRTSDMGPVLRKTTVTVPINTSTAIIPHSQTMQTAPVRKTDPGGNTSGGNIRTMTTVTRIQQDAGAQEKRSGPKALPPSGTAVKVINKQ